MAWMLALWLSLASAAPSVEQQQDDDIVILTSGERLEGVVTEQRSKTIVLRHDILGRLEIRRADIDELRIRSVAEQNEPKSPEQAKQTPDGEAPADAEPADPDEDASPAPPPPEPAIDWDSRLELSFNIREGRTRSRDGRMKWESGFSSDTQNFRYDAAYRIRSDESDRTEQRFTIGSFWERPRIETPWSIFAQGRYEYDEFNAWDQRITGSGGFGYLLYSRDEVSEDGTEFEQWNIKLRGGLGGRQEFGSDDDALNPEGLAGGELALRLSPRQRLSAKSTYYQTLNEKDDYRIVTSADWEVDIDRMDGVSLKLGLAHEHQAQTPPDVRRDDLSIFASLVLNF